ncbi:CYTH domain-containing protein [Rossellomorea aquimaris]|nr:CYTH domain-containing protein [Rossellomorea aquimaris]MCA1056727.1 CYTH domain-containing protein [Rossellomorea aquimaris]
MPQELEIEFKNLLEKDEFLALLEHFNIEESDFISQENHYFDTPDFKLKGEQSALRIRRKGNKQILTLKTPAKEGLLETNQELSTQAADELLESGIMPEGEVKQFLVDRRFPLSLIHFGSLTTRRAEIDFDGGLLVFDESSYFSKVDYELEYEVQDFNSGQETFLNLLKEHGIPRRKTNNKIKRFYEEKVRLGL